MLLERDHQEDISVPRNVNIYIESFLKGTQNEQQSILNVQKWHTWRHVYDMAVKRQSIFHPATLHWKGKR